MEITRVSYYVRSSVTYWLVVSILFGSLNCGGSGGGVDTDFGPSSSGDDAKDRLTQIQRLYQAYIEKNQQPPANEEALKKFGKDLSASERDSYLLIEDLDSCFVSPRDNQPFVVRYGMNLSPGGEIKGIAWESTGLDGHRFVARSDGYVEEYDEESFQQYK